MRRVNWQTVLICLVLAALIAFAFRGVVDLPFVNYDDPGYVTENPVVSQGLTWSGVGWAFAHAHGGNWHPLTSISHMLDCSAFGLNAKWHHLVNLLLHAASAVLLFIALQKMTGATLPSAIAAAVFAVHPLRVESVAWISERKDVLSALFFMLTLIAYVRYTRQPARSRYILVIVLFGLGLMTKPMLVTMPLILLLLDFWPLGRMEHRARRRIIFEKLPLLAMSLASSAATIYAQAEALGSIETMPLSWRFNNAVISVFIYVRQMFWPADLCAFYPHPEAQIPTWQVALGLIGLIGISLFVVLWRKRAPYLFVGWLWYLIMLLPVSGIIFVGLQGHADRYTYLPQIGLCLAIVWGLLNLLGRQAVGRVALNNAAAIVIVLLAWRTSAQAEYWDGSEKLWRRALSVTRDNDVAEVNLRFSYSRWKRKGSGAAF